MLPQVTDYTDYRQYLQAFLDAKRATHKSFTARQFCLKAKVSTDDYLLRILRGKRNLGAQASEQFIQALGLKNTEAQYFRSLVLISSPVTSTQTKDLHLAEIEKTRRKLGKSNTLTDNSLYRRWYVIAILELASCKGVKLTAQHAAQVLRPKISVQEAKEAIDLLLSKSLLIEKNGRYIPTPVSLRSTSGQSDDFVRLNHKETVQAALTAIDLPLEKRGFFGLTIAIDPAKLPQLKSKLKSLIEEIQQDQANDPEAKEVYRIQAHCFPMTESKS